MSRPVKKRVRYRKESNADYCVYVDGKRHRFGSNRDAKLFMKAERTRMDKEERTK